MRKVTFGLALAATAACALPAAAQQPTAGNLEKLGEFKTTGTSMEIPTVPQTGEKADAIRKNLENIKLPPGFKISLYAIVPDARHIASARRASSPSSARARPRSGP